MCAVVTVIMATTCEKRRADEIRRAVGSVLDQEGVEVELIVVVNGNRFDPSLFDELGQDVRLKVFYREQGSFPAAVRFGREQVRTEYFSFIDDDDYLLPGALAARLSAIESPSPIDFVASNGRVELGDQLVPFVANAAAVQVDPLRANIAQNWLGSSAGLFRTSTITPDYFDSRALPYEMTWFGRPLMSVNQARFVPSTVHEWTLLTFRLLLGGRRVRFLDEDTFRKSDTPGSLSKDPGLDPLSCAVAMLETLRPAIPAEYGVPYSAKASAAWHELADFHWRRGNRTAAWLAHWKSIRGRAGLRYLAFTRHLLGSLLLGT